MATDQIKVTSDWVRVDVESVEVSDVNEDGTRPVRFRFSKDRYELLPDGGMRDIRTDCVFPPKTLASMVDQMIDSMANNPMSVPPARPDLHDLIAERRQAIADTLENPAETSMWGQNSAQRLTDLLGTTIGFAAVCVDLVGSTRLQATDRDSYEIIVPLLLRELAEIVGRLEGLVVNFTGDGLIAGFCGA
jgi:hypothetical protein